MVPFGLCTAVRYELGYMYTRTEIYFLIYYVLPSCILQLVYLYFLSPLCSTRVSNELGAGEPQAAKLATRVVMCIALSTGLLLGSTMILLRNYWGYMYSNEPEVITYIARMIPILAISFFTDGLHGSLSG
jgi:Na+-driven multidrug efflux pump